MNAVGLRVLLAACLGLTVMLVGATCHAVAVTVEVTSEVEKLVDAPLARRLIRLELADVELPKVNGTASTDRVSPQPRSSEEVVFVRLLRHGEALIVELWARGELYGERRLVLSSNEQHQARRVALASAELARGLREIRVRERQRLLREHLAPNPETAPAYVTKVSVVGLASLNVTMWPDANTGLVGPRLGIGVVTQSGVGVGLSGGVSTPTAASVVRSWVELAIRPSWQVDMSQHLAFAIGLDAAIGVVDIEPNATFAGSDVSQQTWQTKAGIDARLEWRAGPRVSVLVSPEAGLFARRLSVVREQTSRTLGGPWFGVALGALVYL